MKVSLPYPPSLNHLYFTHRGHRVLSPRGQEFKRTAAILCAAAGMRPIEGPVSVKVHVHRPRKTGDLDNVLKIIFDSMRGIAWEDDKQVVHIEAFRSDDKKNPRAEVTVVKTYADE